MRSTFISTVTELAVQDPNVIVMTGDLGFKIFDDLKAKIGPRFINAGVAEANMVTTAAGLAMSGKRVFCYSIDPFISMRPFEQIRVDVCAHNLPVTLVGVGAALGYAMEGLTHHALEDVSVLRSLPNMTVVAPGDDREVEAIVRRCVDLPGPLYLRLAKDSGDIVHAQVPDFTFGKAIPVAGAYGEADVCLLSSGPMLTRAQELHGRLQEQGYQVELYSVPTIKPMDGALVQHLSRRSKVVFTLEEHSIVGGLGAAVAEALLDRGFRGALKRFALPDAFFDIVGGREYMLKHVGLDIDALERRSRAFLSDVGGECVRHGPLGPAVGSRSHQA